MQQPKNMTTQQAAEYLQSKGIRITPGTLNVWRSLGKGPAFKKVGRYVYYERDVLDQYERGQTYMTKDMRG
jgi:hypothetical protein